MLPDLHGQVIGTHNAALKTRAAAEHPHNREAYTRAKAEFIRRVRT
jgi:GrpB-like predicted nucleotidyltransferase (UPF0157 family)